MTSEIIKKNSHPMGHPNVLFYVFYVYALMQFLAFGSSICLCMLNLNTFL